MASSQDGKTFKQDMVVSIRYRNDLPPPPMPPKLLDIEHGGLAQYLTTGYAAGLARREDPNIDADAEGGMPIDMIGVPGYFLGDETVIMAPEIQPVLDPADAALMLTPDQLRTEGARTKGVSFLRKTEYMNSANAKASSDPLVNKAMKQRKSIDKPLPVARDDKENIRRHIQKSFDLAYPESIQFSEGRGEPVAAPERHSWKNPVHPDNPSLKPVGFYPVLPDLDAVTDGGGNWTYVKFAKSPLQAHHDRRDDRIDAAFVAAVPNQKEQKVWQARKDAYDRDPQRYEDPGPEPYIWSLHVPKQYSATQRVRKIFNDADPAKDTPEFYSALSEEDATGQLRIPFIRARAYPSVKRDFFDPRRIMAISLYDPATAPPQSRLKPQGPAAYYYPIMERNTFKVEGGKSGAGLKSSQQQSQQPRPRPDTSPEDDLTKDLPDELMLLPLKNLTALQKYARYQFRGQYDNTFAEKWDELKNEALAENQADEAAEIEAEQGTLRAGAQDTSLAEVEAADEMEVVGNGDGGPDRDDEVKDGDGIGDGNGNDEDDPMDDSD